MKTLKRLVPGFLVLMVTVTACATTATGRRGFFLISPQQEYNLGSQMDAEVQKQLPINRDPQLNQYVNSVGQRIAAANDYKEVPYVFRIVDDDKTVNAFSLPGGFEYVYTGLLKNLNSEAELASILGHETGHIADRHAAERISIQYGTQILSSLFIGRDSPLWVQLVNQVVTFTGIMAFSRGQENTADRLGTVYADRAGYDPAAMVAVMQSFVNLQKRQPGALEIFFSDHPAPAQRIPLIKQDIAKLPSSATALEVGQDRYKAAVSGLLSRSGPTTRPPYGTGNY